jgi:signal peptidase
MKGIGKKILIFIVLMILLIGLANVLFRFVLPIKPVILGSESMEPTYTMGDILFYRQSNNYTVNDVIVYTIGGNSGVARIIELNGDGTYKLKGDHNPISISSGYMDQTHVKKEQLLGKVSFGNKWFVVYPLLYGVQIIIAVLLTQVIYSKLKK